ncbi:C2HC-type zinc finger protein [Skeletonema marinoi]|uniref:C2HC-type zinc finger protein n=1 Tax=Skeletonema marinoi TaxID=267567 RepID=A0AAD9D4D2_9STRA|nr:C2HC-type zinc finger protein [Skeletonema marinoi]
MESDWSNRRKSAMNRARELRSKIKEMHSDNADDASNTVMSSREIQRQRRSRQLEETKRLLDQFADAEVEVDEQRRVSSNDSVRSGKNSLYGNYGSIEAQVASSQELLSRSHRRDKYSADPPAESGSSQMRIQAESRTVRETSHRQPGQFGRGRGRGRIGSGGGATATSSRQVGSSLQSSKPFPRDYTAVEMPSAQQGQVRNKFSASNENTAKPQCFYLRDHRVPEHKDGECDKLVVLRQRLAARRRMRELALEGGTKEQKIEPSSMHGMEKPHSHRVDNEAVPHEHSARQHTNQFSHKDVDDANRSHRSSHNNDNATQLNISTGSAGSIASEKSVVDIELVQCDCCGRSFAPKVYEKHFDSSGQPKCVNDKNKKRPVFNSAKARIANNSNLNQDEQRQVLQMNKKVSKDLAKKKNGKGRTMEKIRRSSKWRDESRAFRDAMKASKL